MTNLDNKKTVAVFGSGAYGCVLADVIQKGGNNAIIWSYSPVEKDIINNQHICPILQKPIDARIVCTNSKEEAVKSSQYILIVTSSEYVRSTAREISEFLGSQPVVIASKGMEGGKVFTQVVSEEIGREAFVFSGPSHAEQIIEGYDTFVDYYGPQDFKEVMSTDTFHLVDCDDPIGMQIGGALKNIIAIGVGFLEGAGYPSNTTSAYKTFGWEEVESIAKLLNAKRLGGLSGKGDLDTTTESNDSRNKKCGLALAKGKTANQIVKEMHPATIEGLNAIKAAMEVIKEYKLNCPIMESLNDIVSIEGEFNPTEEARKLVKSMV